MIKTLLKTLLLLAALGYLAFALIKVSRPPQEMVCTGVEYQFLDSTETRLIDQQMVSNQLAQHKISPKGKTLADIDIKGIEKLLSANPYIDTVTCYHTASGKLCIRIKPLHPIMHVFAEDGDEFYLDRQGHVMPAGGLGTNLPVVTGYATRKYASTKLIPLATLLKDDPYWSRMAQQVNIDSKGHVEIIPRISEQKIRLGEPKNFAEKLQHVRLFYEKGMPKTGWNKYNVVNAAYRNQIICTKE